MKRKSKTPRNERRSVIKAEGQAKAARALKPTNLMRTDQLMHEFRFTSDRGGKPVITELRKRKVIQ